MDEDRTIIDQGWLGFFTLTIYPVNILYIYIYIYRMKYCYNLNCYCYVNGYIAFRQSLSVKRCHQINLHLKFNFPAQYATVIVGGIHLSLKYPLK